ncbi:MULTISPECIES: hypothetical protein [unclassified Paenibacillus]|uniref:hypothetical protein n=1 Tax=unclassified Paenibacillus TaxID=185978 RepID=UPI0009301522|nr:MULTISPECIES: hypothetical protein [unclassified Paenibacillus]
MKHVVRVVLLLIMSGGLLASTASASVWQAETARAVEQAQSADEQAERTDEQAQRVDEQAEKADDKAERGIEEAERNSLAAEEPNRGSVMTHVTILSLPGLSFLELAPGMLDRYPALRSLSMESDVAAMNVRLSDKGTASVYATWGAGAPVRAKGAGASGWRRPARFEFLSRGGPWFHANQTNAAGMEGRVRAMPGAFPAIGEVNGWKAEDRGWRVPGIERLQARNQTGGFRSAPGTLGGALRDEGVRAAAWSLGRAGFTDRSREENRSLQAALMVTDELGHVPGGGYATVADASRLLRQSWLQAGGTRRPVGAGDAPSFAKGSLNVLEYDGLARAYAGTGQSGAAGNEEVVKPGDQQRLALSEVERLVALVRSAVVIRSRQRPAERHMLWLVSPAVHPEAVREKKLLTPVFRWSPSRSREDDSVGIWTGPRIMTSATTYREGIVAASDLAPTLLAEFGLSATRHMIGQPIRSLARNPGGTPTSSMNQSAAEGEGRALSWLLGEMDSLSGIYRLRPPLLYGLAVYEIAVMLLGLAAAWMLFGGSRGLFRGLQLLLLSILWMPALLIALGWANGSGARGFGLVLLVLAASAASWRASAAAGRRSALIRILALCGIGVSLLIVADGLLGAPLMKRSVLGYDAMIGARYYGIGNECMGVLLGASLLGLSAALELVHGGRRKKDARRRGLLRGIQVSARTAWIRLAAKRGAAPAARRAAAPGQPGWLAAWPAAAVGSLTTAALAAPAVGANAGGALAAGAGFGVLAARLASGGPLRWRRLSLALALPVAAALAGLWLLNAAALPAPAGESGSAAAAVAAAAAEPGSALLPSDAGRSTHIGRAFASLRQGRWDDIAAIVRRKLTMNLHLLQVSAWSKVLLTGLLVMAALVLRPKGRLRAWEKRYPFLMHGCCANVLGSLAALVLNDSGIVAAAAMIVYGSVPLLLLCLQEKGAEAEV